MEIMKLCIPAVKCFILQWYLYLDYMALNGRMSGKWKIGKDLEGSGHGIMKVLS
jgi:hypothetical protein